jgi:dTMP kinase
MSRAKGFISFEGIEGSGKSTQAKTAEPGGTNIGQKIREILLEPENHMEPITELLLYYASRAQHVREVIYPAILDDTIVITDRFSDSTIAYQGYARGIDLKLLSRLNEIVNPDLKPFLTLMLDLDVEEGLKRNRKASKEDRFELETVEFHNRVRKGFLQIASEEPERVKVIDASRSQDEISKEIIKLIEEQWH